MSVRYSAPKTIGDDRFAMILKVGVDASGHGPSVGPPPSKMPRTVSEDVTEDVTVLLDDLPDDIIRYLLQTVNLTNPMNFEQLCKSLWLFCTQTNKKNREICSSGGFWLQAFELVFGKVMVDEFEAEDNSPTGNIKKGWKNAFEIACKNPELQDLKTWTTLQMDVVAFDSLNTWSVQPIPNSTKFYAKLRRLRDGRIRPQLDHYQKAVVEARGASKPRFDATCSLSLDTTYVRSDGKDTYEIVKELLEQENGNPNMQEELFGSTALHHALSVNNHNLRINLIKLLLEYKASADIVNARGETPICRALEFTNRQFMSSNEFTTIAELLIPNMSKIPLYEFMENVVRPGELNGDDGVFLLRLCLERGATTRGYILHGLMRSNWQDNNKMIALELMLAHKAPVISLPLLDAVGWNFPIRGIKMLLDHGAFINVEDMVGDTALILAVINRNYEQVQLLLSYKELDMNFHRRKLAPLIEFMDSNIKNLLVDANLISPIHTT